MDLALHLWCCSFTLVLYGMCNASAHPVCSNELSWSNIILLSPAYSSFLGRQTADLTSLSISPLSFYFTFFFSLQHFPVLMVLIPTCMYLCGFLPFFFTSSLLCVPVPSICILQPYLRSFQVWVVPFQTSSSVSLVSSLISLALFLCYSLTLYVFFSIFSSFSFLWQYFL